MVNELLNHYGKHVIRGCTCGDSQVCLFLSSLRRSSSLNSRVIKCVYLRANSPIIKEPFTVPFSLFQCFVTSYNPLSCSQTVSPPPSSTPKSNVRINYCEMSESQEKYF